MSVCLLTDASFLLRVLTVIQNCLVLDGSRLAKNSLWHGDVILLRAQLYCAFRDGQLAHLALLKGLFLLHMDWTRDFVSQGRLHLLEGRTFFGKHWSMIATKVVCHRVLYWSTTSETSGSHAVSSEIIQEAFAKSAWAYRHTVCLGVWD